MTNDPFVSVIIPVLNDSERLAICLNALEQQSYPKGRYEVIVVDNGSAKDLTEGLTDLVNGISQAALTYEPQPGSYAARNHGLSSAQGEIIAFTDSDCIPAHDWLETGIKHLLSVPNCGLAAGRISVFFKDPNRPTAVELYDSITFLQQQKYIEEFKYGATANLFTFQRVFEDVGYFDDKLLSGGDLEWGQRVFSHGYPITYAEDSCVAHPARYSLIDLYKKIVRISRGHHALDKAREDNARDTRSSSQTMRLPLRSTFRKVKSDHRLKTNRQKAQVFLIMIFVHYLKLYTKLGEKARWYWLASKLK